MTRLVTAHRAREPFQGFVGQRPDLACASSEGELVEETKEEVGGFCWKLFPLWDVWDVVSGDFG